MAVCNNCGSKVPDGAEKCEVCGSTDIVDSLLTKSVTDIKKELEKEFNKTIGSSSEFFDKFKNLDEKKKNKIFLAIFFVFLCLFGVLAFCIFSQGIEQKKDVNGNEAKKIEKVVKAEKTKEPRKILNPEASESLNKSLKQIKGVFGDAKNEIASAFSEALKEMESYMKESLSELINSGNVSVLESDKGLVLSLENIQFKPDSAILEDTEIEKLKEICNALKKSKQKLYISGHCADVGSMKSQVEISKARADAVAAFLVNEGVRKETEITTEGRGSLDSIGDDNTKEGRAKNRRVEIVLLNDQK